MKKNYIILLLSIAALLNLEMKAALSGVYTINSGLATTGTNFQTFSAFAAALTSQGVSGPVTVNVSGGPFVEQVVFTAITGVSSTNTITINGNNCLVDFTGSSGAPHTVWLNGADRMYFHSLNFKGNGSASMVVSLTNGSNDNMFSLCTFSCPSNGTGTQQIPLNISGSNLNYYTAGANHRNIFSGCETFSGYFNTVVYGTTGMLPSDNKFLNHKFLDFYVYGAYIQYAKNTTMKGCLVERLTRTTVTTCYAIMIGSSEGTLLEGNTVQKLQEMVPNGNNYIIGIYMYYNSAGSGANPNIIRNNIVRDIKTNGTLYGMQVPYIDGYIYHNTVSLDHTGSTSSNQSIGIYTYGQNGYPVVLKNNLVTITKGGSGTKVGIYVATTGNFSSSNNNVYLNATNTNYGYYSGYQTLAGMQSFGFETNSTTFDPVYTNLAGQNLLPTNTSMNNLGAPLGVATDHSNLFRSMTTPDIGALEFLSVNCTGTPSAGVVVTPTYEICPGESVHMYLSNFTSDLGMTYQWNYSTQSAVGQWTTVPGANSVEFTAVNVGVTSWFQAVVTCTNSAQSVQVVGQVTVAGTTTNTAPYYEDFEGISKTNRLPNCSWYTNDLGGTVLTYTSANNQNRVPRSGSKFASYYYSPSGTRSMYTNGIWLDAGVTYSASVWYTTEFQGYNNWTDLSILVGPNQSATGQQTVASTNGPAVSVIYKSLSNTFSVASSGLYYVEVRATVNNSSYAYYLSWDDLAIEIPCSINAPVMNITSNQSTVCVNSPVSLIASGADTYTWSTGDNGSSSTTTPMLPGLTTYWVMGENTLSGCVTTATLPIYVSPAPNIYIVANPPIICEGESTMLQAFGANNYIWSNNQAGVYSQFSPPSTGTIAVNGTNAFQCQGVAVMEVTVNSKPNITASNATEMCRGDVIPITGSGGQSYVIVSPSSHNSSNPAMVSPLNTSQFTITGTDANGCENFTVTTIVVNDCVGLNEVSGGSALKVYPNPTSGNVIIAGPGSGKGEITVSDVTGRVLKTVAIASSETTLELDDLAQGVYYITVSTQNAVESVRIIKE